MLRIITIITMAIALLTGSTGMTSYLHSCRMATADRPGCRMCARVQPPAESSKGLAFRAIPCCTTTQHVHIVDAGTFSRVDLSAPILPLLFIASVDLRDPLAPILLQSSSDRFERPPPLASRLQASYLLNSTLLI